MASARFTVFFLRMREQPKLALCTTGSLAISRQDLLGRNHGEGMDQSIETRYPLELVPLCLAGERLEIYRVGDLDPFIESLQSDTDAALEGFPFWVKIWEAAFILANHLLRMNLNRDATILEIGAGMGIAGLFLAKAGHPVTVTDANADALQLLAMNAHHNGLDNLTVREMDWGTTDLQTHFDIVCGSELIYSEGAVAPVIQALRDHLAPDGTALMAHDIGRRWLTRFVETAEADFDVGHQVNRVSDERGTQRILVTRLKKKPKKTPERGRS